MKKFLAMLLAAMLVLSMGVVAMAVVADTDVCKIGDVGYATLADAVDAVQSGETIELLKDTMGSGVKVNSGNDFVFDLGGFTYTVTNPTVGSSGTETNGFQLLKNSNLTFKNGTITSDTNSAKILIQNYCNLTLDNVKLVGTDANLYVASNNFGSLTVKNGSEITAADGKVAFDVYYWPDHGYGDGITVMIEAGSVINGKIEYGSDGTEPGKQNVADKANLIINGGEFNGEISTYGLSEPAENGIVVNGGTFDFDVTEFLADGLEQKTDGSVGVPAPVVPEPTPDPKPVYRDTQTITIGGDEELEAPVESEENPNTGAFVSAVLRGVFAAAKF